MPYFINKVLLPHSHILSFMCVSVCFPVTRGELTSLIENMWPAQGKMFTLWPFTEKKIVRWKVDTCTDLESTYTESSYVLFGIIIIKCPMYVMKKTLVWKTRVMFQFQQHTHYIVFFLLLILCVTIIPKEGIS